MEEITAVLEKIEDAIRDVSIPGMEELVTVIFQNAKVLDDIHNTLDDILKELKKRNEKS
jgi:very-short-patch-repair endonuclease